jgi:hypothetical protein
MLKRIGLAVGLLLALIMSGVATAQEITPRHTDPFWQVSYWNNTTLSGPPVVSTSDTNLNHDWGFGSPNAQVNADYFSARWQRYIDVTPGTYRFTATSDDGIRVWVDDDLIIDQWRMQPVTTFSADKYLSGGHHLIKVEYFEENGAAVAKLSWTLASQPPPTTIQHWRGEYYNNKSLSGSPALVRDDPEINFYWAGGSPAPGFVNPDGFSVRWTRTLNLAAGSYRFHMTVDDGARLFVNGHLLIDAWMDQGTTAFSGDIYLPGGNVLVQMEYYENNQNATAVLNWSPSSGDSGDSGTPIQYWKGEYFNNRDLSGSPALVRDDREINFDWGTGSPAQGTVREEEFSARWTRTLNLSPGTYRFSMTVDDGGRLYVNDRLVIDSWRIQPATTYTADVYHGGGSLNVRMEYFEHSNVAVAKLSWSAGGYYPTPTPYPPATPTPPSTSAVIVDDADASFIRGGNASGWSSAPEGYNGRLTWTRNNEYARSGYNWGRWYPNLKSGWYQVYVYIPDRYTTTGNARYWISHAGGFTLRTVNQSANGGRWVSLGTYQFRGNSQDYVSLADVTYEAQASRLIAWDAVKWEPR